MYLLILRFQETKHPFAVTYVIPSWNSMGFLYKQEILPGDVSFKEILPGKVSVSWWLHRVWTAPNCTHEVSFFSKLELPRRTHNNNLKYFLIYFLAKQRLLGNIRRSNKKLQWQIFVLAISIPVHHAVVLDIQNKWPDNSSLLSTHGESW